MRLFPPVVLSFLVPALITLPMRADPVVPGGLHLSAILENGAVIVTVTDDAGVAIADAAVALRLAETAAGGSVSYTDQRGEARFPAASLGAGRVAVKIVATKGPARATMLFEQPATRPSTPEVAIVQPGQKQRVPEVPAEIPPMPREPAVPTVSITRGPTGEHFGSGGHKKWILVAALAGAGAGAVFVLAGKKSSSTATASSTGLSIGTPTVSVGAP